MYYLLIIRIICLNIVKLLDPTEREYRHRGKINIIIIQFTFKYLTCIQELAQIITQISSCRICFKIQ